ncbi:MAG: hypothetical protein ACLP5H_32950 [Desulfomonilaceae bacterium]
MKRVAAMVLVVVLCLFPAFGLGDEVKGYKKKDGATVDTYHRTPPNHTKIDNYSGKGATNPYTGKKGTKPY